MDMAKFLFYLSTGVLACLLAAVGLFLRVGTEPTLKKSPTVTIPPTVRPRLTLPSGQDPESLALRRALRNGERIYQRLCYHCHGRQGKGDNNAYMESIGHKPADHTELRQMQTLSDDEFYRALRDGVKDERGWLTMPPWESVLTDRDMWDVIAYVRRLPLAQPTPTP